jgi:hypothetical protein
MHEMPAEFRAVPAAEALRQLDSTPHGLASADALIILGIVLASGVLGFWQERGAAHAADKLLAVGQAKATVLRDAGPKEIPVAGVVPGDVVVLSAGKSIPGDCLILVRPCCSCRDHPRGSSGPAGCWSRWCPRRWSYWWLGGRLLGDDPARRRGEHREAPSHCPGLLAVQSAVGPPRVSLYCGPCLPRPLASPQPRLPQPLEPRLVTVEL